MISLSHGTLWRVALLLFVVNLLLLWIYFHISHGGSTESSSGIVKNFNLRASSTKRKHSYYHSIEVGGIDVVAKQYSPQMSNELQEQPLDAELLLAASKNATSTLHYEERVKQYASFYNHYKSEYRSANKTNLLCSTFINLNEDNIDFVSKNVLHSENTCDWLIIVYKYDETRKEELVDLFQKNVSASLNALLAMQKGSSTGSIIEIKVFLEFAIEKTSLLASIEPLCEKYVRRESTTTNQQKPSFNPCDLSAFPLMSHTIDPITGQSRPPELPPHFNHLLYPKIVLFVSYLKYVARYNYIWSLDSDISLEAFDMHYFLRIFGCSFVQPPIVSQPLIDPSTQAYSYLNHILWKQTQEFQMSKFNRTLKSTAAGFVEIQAPLFNAFYLEFFIMSFLVPLLPQTFILGGDWGFDELFCQGAKTFANLVLDSPFVPSSQTSTIHCALIVDGTPVLHVNKHTTDGIVGTSNKLVLDNELVHLTSTTFPSFSVNGNMGGCSPDQKHFIKVFDLKENCKFDY